MTAEDNKPSPSPPLDTPSFLSSQQAQEKTVWLPWLVAALVVMVGIGTWIALGGHGKPDNQVPGAGMLAPDPYAGNLRLSGLVMSEATSFSGAKVTYVDGQIVNSGSRTLTGITVQVGFHDATGQYAERLALPLSLIRTREPYIDTEAVSADPIAPGQERAFRLIFDSVPAEWNQQYPEIRVIAVRAR